MSPEERNYPVADKEMLSVIRSLDNGATISKAHTMSLGSEMTMQTSSRL
jgi:hypothetical protein